MSKAGLARLLALCAVIAIVSAGLCGANAALFSHFGYISGPNDPHRSAGFSMFLMFMGGVELFGMAIGLIGTLITALMLLGVWIYSLFTAKSDKED